MKKILFTIIFVLMTANLFADGDLYKKPGKNEVVVITSVTLSPTPDNAFFSKYRNLKSELNGVITKKEEIVLPGVVVTALQPEDDEYLMKNAFIAYDSEIGCFKAEITKKERNVIIRYIISYLGSINNFFPIVSLTKKQFTIPDGVQYVYIGSFVCEWEGVKFDIKSIKQIDRYDEAVKFVAEKYGAAAKVVRVPLSDFYFEDEKKEE
jgi:hypothetical protein